MFNAVHDDDDPDRSAMFPIPYTNPEGTEPNSDDAEEMVRKEAARRIIQYNNQRSISNIAELWRSCSRAYIIYLIL